MCLTSPRVIWNEAVNWDGGEIVHDAVVGSSRPVVLRRRGGYDIDPREFLVSESNAVMRRTLGGDIKDFVDAHPFGSVELFTSRRARAFDHRADMISGYVSKNIRYRIRRRRNDPWQFPDETLELGSGDCEDRALLLASLLLASGISSFNVRVGLGYFRTWDADGRQRSHDHVWVMYKSEAGKWLVLEPAITRQRKGLPPPPSGYVPVRAEYLPHFLFNDVHLWAMAGHAPKPGDTLDLKRDWSRVHPAFAGHVHRTIMSEALKGTGYAQDTFDPWFSIKWNRAWTVDAVDKELYDPRDHFDNGFIREGWQLVNERLARFKADNTELDAFFHAAHGIADFYAHSSYGHFAGPAGKPMPLFDPGNLDKMPGARYDQGTFDLRSTFTRNKDLFPGDGAQAAAEWPDKVISGRYKQPGDNKQGFIESLVVRESPAYKAMLREPSFKRRGSLPHHDEIAVDDADKGGKHRLYPTNASYRDQFDRRKRAAIEHIHKAFMDNLNPKVPPK